LTKVTEAYRRPPAAQRSYGDAGTVVYVERNTSYTITGSIAGSTTVEAGVIFAKASVQVGASVSNAKTVSTSTGASWRVPSNQHRGWLEMGALGYDVAWYKKVWNSGKCRWTIIKGKTVKGVTASAWFKHS
jgi:hypothetical protein